jgi:hypothetical protein
MKKNINGLAKLICSLEGKKVEVSIAQVKEIIGIISDIIDLERNEKGVSDTIILLMDNGHKRAYKAYKAMNKKESK